MTTNTPNLNLVAYNTLEDADIKLLYTMIDNVSGGSAIGGNLGKIDTFAGETSASITSASASIENLNGKVLGNTKSAVIQAVNPASDVNTSSGSFVFWIPSELDGMVLYRAGGFANTPTSSGSTAVQLRNVTAYPANNILSTAIKIESGSKVGMVGVVDSNYSTVSTNDEIWVHVTVFPDPPAKGLQVVLEYVYP